MAMMISRIAVITTILFASCSVSDGVDPTPVDKRLVAMSYVHPQVTNTFSYEYDESGMISEVFLDDTLYLRLIFKNDNELIYRHYSAHPGTDSIDAHVTVTGNKIRTLANAVMDVQYNGIYPTQMHLNPYMFAELPGSGTFNTDDNFSSNYTYFDDSVVFDFQLTYQYPPWTPFPTDPEVFYTRAHWRLGNHSSPVPLPMQDVGHLGVWFNFGGLVYPHTLLDILNISGYSTYIPERLVDYKLYPGLTSDTIHLNYEFDMDGYVTRMFARSPFMSPYVNESYLEFTYLELP